MVKDLGKEMGTGMSWLGGLCGAGQRLEISSFGAAPIWEG